MKRANLIILLGSIIFVGLLAYLANYFLTKSPTVSSDNTPEIRIGFSLGDLREERWQKDRDFFVAAAKKLGAYVQVTSANSDATLQNTQVENMISQKFDVIVISPYDSEKIAGVVILAHKSNIKVISYDRLIKNAKVDFYVSFDNIKVGNFEAQGIVDVKNSGNFAYIGGAPTDNNSTLLKKGSMDILDPLIKDGSVKLVVDKFMIDWKPEEAYITIKNYLAGGGKLDAIIAANDGTAYGAINALKEFQLDGKVPVSGQDAELSACQRIIQGTQTMTVYKPITALANKAASIAVEMATGKTPIANNETNDGQSEIPSFFIEPILVTKSNIDETIIKDGFHTKSEVYQNTSIIK
ncbi:MAG: substrate-binding domain-containing protein [Candidatus Shapirobacteria bacterium]